MSSGSNVRITVKSQKGHCACGHKVGDCWIIDGKIIKTPDGLCHFAYQSFEGALLTLIFGGIFPWEKDPDTAIAACPDADNPCVFELRRIRE